MSVVSLAMGTTLGYKYGANKTKVEVQKESDDRHAQTIHILQQSILEYDKKLKTAQQTNVAVSEQHRVAIASISGDLDTARRNIAANGLRIPKGTICNPGNMPATPTSPGGHHGDIADTILLPEPITTNLLTDAGKADEVTEIARACQNWVRAQGMYGAIN